MGTCFSKLNNFILNQKLKFMLCHQFNYVDTQKAEDIQVWDEGLLTS